MDDEQDEQLDFGDDAELVEEGAEEEQFVDDGYEQEEDVIYEEGDDAEDNGDENLLQGLGDEDMQDVPDDAAAENGHEEQQQEEQEQQDGQEQQLEQERGSKEEQADQQGKKSGIIRLDQPSKRVIPERFQPKPTQQELLQQQVQQFERQQQQQQQQQQPKPPGSVSSRPVGSSTLRGPLRYFMLKCVTMDNWQAAQQESCWATQPHNERLFGEAFRRGQEVVLFMSVNLSGAIQGYGRMASLPGKGPAQVAWKDISLNVNNFLVSWDCCVPLPFAAVDGLRNPWNDPKAGPLSKGDPLPLSRHRDGQELAPQVGEQLLEAMNKHAAKAGKPVTGPLAAGVARGRQQMQMQQRLGVPAPQMHHHQQQRMIMQQQQQQRGMPGRGMMGGPLPGPPGMMRPGSGRMPVQPPPPVRGRPLPGGPLLNDPRLNPRFAGRLQMDHFDHLPGLPHSSSAGGPRGGSPPHHGRGPRDDRGQHDRGMEGSRRYDRGDRRGDGDRDWDWERGRGHEQQHPSRGRYRSRSRSRSPPRAASSRGGSTGRGGGAGVTESSWGEDGSRERPSRQQQAQDEEPESMPDMSYEQYLAAWERVQQRIKVVKADPAGTELALVPQQQQQMQALQQLPGPLQQQQGPLGAGGGMMGGAGGPGRQLMRRDGMGMGMAAGGGGGVGGVGVGGMMGGPGPGMRGGDGGNGMMQQQGPAAGAAATSAGRGVDGAASGPGRPLGNPQIPTLEE